MLQPLLPVFQKLHLSFLFFCWIFCVIATIAEDDCLLEADDSGLTLDAVCFVFLLLQLRIYKSHYFTHVVLELEVQNKLAARGAELINTNLIKRVEHERANERAVLESIRQKMEKIRTKQEEMQERLPLNEDLNHYDSKSKKTFKKLFYRPATVFDQIE